MPSVLPDAVVTNAATSVTINVLANDTGTGLTITSFSNPANGSLVFNGDKTFTYTPASGFIGEDSFAYTVRDAQGTPANAEVTITVIANTGATVATNDVVEVTAGGSVIIPVLANDMAAGNAALQIIAVSTPGHGAVNVLPDQTIRYVPQSSFVGIDSFNYTVTDGQGSSSSATVTIKVLTENSPPLAGDDTFTVEAGQPTMFVVMANDSDPDGGPLQVVGFTMPSHGELVFNQDNIFTFTPTAGYLGNDQFTYTIRDNRGASALASVTLIIAEVNEAPTAHDDQVTTEAGVPATIDVLANDTVPADQQISIVAVTLPYRGKLVFNPDKTITYSPNAGFVGIDDFSYTISNSKGGIAKAKVAIEVTPASSPEVYANGYACRRRLAIPANSAKGSSHENFPLWVELAGSWLKSTANGGKVFSADGHDLRFELEDGTKLAHELEHYDSSVGKLGAWVRLPELAAGQPTVALLYYGKPDLAASEAQPAIVWQDYLAVWHLPGTSDRSGQERDLVAYGSVQTTATGLGAGAVSLNGDGVLKIDDASWLDGLEALSMQLRSKAASVGHDQGLLGAGAALFTNDGDVFIQYQASGLGEGQPKNVVHSKIRTTAGELLTSSAADVHKTDWQSVALTWQSGEWQSHLYLDGTKVQPSYKSQIDAAGTTRISGPVYAGSGPQDGESGGWTGLLDEVRFRAEQLDPAWIEAEHVNQSDPARFFGIGAEEGFEDDSASPVAVPIEVSIQSGTWIDLDVRTEAVLPSGTDGVTIQSVTQPANGHASVINGKVRYTPATGVSGSDSFTYTLSLAGKTSTAKIYIALLAIPSDYLARVDVLVPAAHYRMAETSGTIMVDRIAGKNGSWHNGPRLGIDPLVLDSAAGKSVGFKLTDEPVHGRINNLVQTASFTIDLALQLDRIPTPKYIVLTTGGGNTPGEVSLEIETDGQGGAWARFWSVASNGAPVVWRTGAGTVPVARAFKLSFRRDGGTGAIDLFVDGIILPKTLVQGSAPSSWSAVPARTWSLGEWPGSASAPYGGLMAELVAWPRALAAAELQTLARAQNVVWLSDFNVGSVISSQLEAINLTPYAHPVAGIIPTIVAPPALGTATIADTTINYTAGASVGADELAARITANGVSSRNARIDVTVARVSTSASDGWTNGWEGLSESPRGWLPDPLSSSAFNVAYRSWSSPPGYVNFGSANHQGRNGVMYRQMDQDMPVFNSDRRADVGFPAGTMAVHLEWWAYIDESARMINGKRFGFNDPGGAGGGTVGGSVDTTTSGLGLPGGWSIRWTCRGSSASSLRPADRHSIYFYSQNRRNFGANFTNGRLYGATINTAGGTLPRGEWVKVNWTIVLNSPNTADGMFRLWVNDTQLVDRPGILWQEDINQHAFHRFWWSWMWGGVPERYPPPSTFREYYGDFRIGVTSRANAIANPWPF